MKEYFTTKRIAMLALFTALIAVATAVISIPGPIGYTNFGDTFIYIGAALFGPVFGMITGGLGSMTADLFLAPQYAPFTLIIKGLEGFLCGFLFRLLTRRNQNRFLSLLIASIVAACEMVAGYFATECILYTTESAFAAIPANLIQGGVSIAAGIFVIALLRGAADAETVLFGSPFAKKGEIRVALFHDLSGFGRCSLTAAIPVFTSMGIQANPFPTAILSNQTGFDSFYMRDFTPFCEAYLAEWKKLNVSFDAIYSGFMASPAEADIIRQLIEQDKSAMVVIDPVLGDNGAFYKNFTDDLGEKMKRLVARADYVTPNLTEACFLSGECYEDVAGIAENDAFFSKVAEIGEKLRKNGAKNIVITGIVRGGKIYNVCFSEGKAFRIAFRHYPQHYSGTGDLFTSVMTACILKGKSLRRAVKTAGRFVKRAVGYSVARNAEGTFGVDFEQFLHTLH